MSAIYREPGGPFPGRPIPHRDDFSGVEMLLPAGISDCVVFVFGHDRKGRLKPYGTAFVLSDPVPGAPGRVRVYLITARHVIEQIRHDWNPETAYDTDEPYVYLRTPVTKADGKPLQMKLPLAAWFFHPKDSSLTGEDWKDVPDDKTPRYDVAAVYCPQVIVADTKLKVLVTTTDMFDQEAITETAAGIGDDVAITGLYYQHVGRAQNVPIFRSGVIAAMPVPDEPVRTGLGAMYGAYLIESRSTGGLSGSPAFWVSSGQRVDYESRSLRSLPVPYVRLMGLVQGHYDEDAVTPLNERINEGIAIVEPVEHILETIHQEKVVAAHKEADREARRQVAPALDSVSDDDEEPDESRVSLAGVEPDDALRALLKTPPRAPRSHNGPTAEHGDR